MAVDAVLAGVTSLALTAGLMPAALRFLRARGVVDHPNHRSSHRGPVLRGAGLAPAIAAGLVVSGAAWLDSGRGILLVHLAVGLGLAALGLADDLRGLGPLPRLGVQAVLALTGAIGLASVASVAPVPLRVAGPVLILIVAGAVLVITNMFNFMDGINGISAISAMIWGLALTTAGLAEGVGTLAVAGAAVAGAAAGFAPWNVVRARAFLGDVGSYFLGGTLALLAAHAIIAGVPLPVVGAPFLIYAADTGTTLLRRARRGERLLEAHRSHVYQRLTKLGCSHLGVASFVGALTLLCTVCGFTVGYSAAAALRWTAAGGLLALPLVYVGSPAVVVRWNPQTVRSAAG